MAPIWRHFVKLKVFEAMDAAVAQGHERAGAALVDVLFDSVLERYPQLRNALTEQGAA
jgi:N-methylhydantoinase B